jgi:hypothetical protein
MMHHQGCIASKENIMKKLILLAGIAAFAAFPVTASATENGPPPGDHGGNAGGRDTASSNISEDVDVDVDYDNKLYASIDVDVEYDKTTSLTGSVRLNGNINVNSSAVAVSDPKQMIENNLVNSNTPNTVSVGSVSGTGNVGVNAASGILNQQANIGTIASAPGGDLNSRDSDSRSKGGKDEKEQGNSGWAEANTVSLQKVYGNEFNTARGATSGANSTTVTSVSGTGNIGVNAASGAFNAQENVLTMAVVKDGALAEANAGIMQVSWGNEIVSAGGSNGVNVGTVTGNGNMGVNAASGIGNIQSNSLTIATSAH